MKSSLIISILFFIALPCSLVAHPNAPQNDAAAPPVEPKNATSDGDDAPLELPTSWLYFHAHANVSVEAYKQYLEMLRDGRENVSRGELRQRLIQWAEQNGFKPQFEAAMSADDAERQLFHDENLSNLGGAAFDSYQRMVNISRNMSLTQQQECDAYNFVFQSLTKRLREIVPDPYYRSGPDCMRPRYKIAPPANCPPGLILIENEDDDTEEGCGGGSGGCPHGVGETGAGGCCGSAGCTGGDGDGCGPNCAHHKRIIAQQQENEATNQGEEGCGCA